jgi:hypothetical protein
MSLIKKSDVKNHISSSRRKKGLCRPESRSDATGFSVAGLNAVKAKQLKFIVDYSTEHAIAGVRVTPTANSTGFTGPQAPAASKSAQT